MKNFKSYVFTALTLAAASGSVLADRCNVSVNLRERFNNPAGMGYAVANVGDLLSEVERSYGVRTQGILVTGLSLEVQADTDLIMAWKDVSGRNQNSGAAIPVRYGRGSYRINDAHWRNMTIGDRGAVRPYNIDVNATGSGVVTGAQLTLQAPTQVCSQLRGGYNDGGYDDGGYDDDYRDDRSNDRRDDDYRDYPNDRDGEYREIPNRRIPRRGGGVGRTGRVGGQRGGIDFRIGRVGF